MTKLDFHFGVPVHARDRQCGKLAKIVFDPKTLQVSALIVQKGWIFKKARVIPVAKVERTTPFEIRLDLDYAEFKRFAKFSQFESSRSGTVPAIRRRLREGVATSAQTLGRKTCVENITHQLGKINHVILDRETRLLSDVVMRAGLYSSSYMVPVTKIEKFQGKSILVSLSEAELSALPRCIPRTDADILADVLDALLSEETGAFHAVEPEVDGGVVRLTGDASSPRVKFHIEELVRRVPGVIDVKNDLSDGVLSSFRPISYDVPIVRKPARARDFEPADLRRRQGD